MGNSYNAVEFMMLKHLVTIIRLQSIPPDFSKMTNPEIIDLAKRVVIETNCLVSIQARNKATVGMLGNKSSGDVKQNATIHEFLRDAEDGGNKLLEVIRRYSEEKKAL